VPIGLAPHGITEEHALDATVRAYVSANHAHSVTDAVGPRSTAEMLLGFAIGLAFITVPDVERVPRSEAQCAIVDAGLRWRDNEVRRSYARAPTCAPNQAVMPDPTVVRQRPSAGARVPRGTIVVLTDTCTRRRPCR
jgi:hypothetical protein